MRTRIWIALLAVSMSVQPGWATCGGGGGGGRGGSGQTYATSWTSRSWEKTLKVAKGLSQGVLLYFPPAGMNTEHRFFRTKIANDLSKERFFFRAPAGDKSKKLRAEFKPDGKKHVVVVCEYHGNVLRAWKAADKSKISGKSVRTTLYGADKQAKRIAKKIERALTPAENAIDAGKWAAAIRALAPFVHYKGYPAAEKVRTLWERIVASGNKQVDDAAAIQDASMRRAKLVQLKRSYKGTEVEGRCSKELGEKPREKQDSQSATPAEEAWQELYGDMDWSAPSDAERVEAAVRAGLAHENAGRYDHALESYALAAALDPKDPIPLVHLGELYRHHLGRWTEAQKMFQRVLDLDRNHRSDDHAVAIALHGIGKMTIWKGDNKGGLSYFAKSIARRPTPLCYRNLAVYWYTAEGETKKAFGFAKKAFDLDPDDSYNQVFYAVHLAVNGHEKQADTLIRGADFDPSMSYNHACYHALKGDRALVLKYLKRHFFEYETCDAVRAFEMAEARMDAFFRRWYDDPEFQQLTVLAGKTAWLR